MTPLGRMDRQTLRDWVHRFNDQGPDGLCDAHAGGVEPRLSTEKLAELAAIVEAGLDARRMASFAGGGSIFSGSSKSASALTIASDTSVRF